jgi:hypothetical protein
LRSAGLGNPFNGLVAIRANTTFFLTAVYTALPAYKFQLNDRQTPTLNEYRAALGGAHVFQGWVAPVPDSEAQISQCVAFVTIVNLASAVFVTSATPVSVAFVTSHLLNSNLSST